MVAAVVVPDWSRTSGGLYVPMRARRKPARPTCIDLFCGCGGFSLGMMQAGWEVLAGLDFDAYASMTYMVNLGSYPMQIHFGEQADRDRLEKALAQTVKRKNKKRPNAGLNTWNLTTGSGWISHEPNIPPVRNYFFGDIRKFTGKQILDILGKKVGEVDCICGGPPCQGFSTVGKQEVMDPRNSLVFEFARLICEIQPKTLIMENVPGILSMVTPEGVPVVDALCHVLETGGFGSWEALKQSLLISSGTGVAIGNRPVGGLWGDDDEDEDDEEQQQSLFEEARP